MRVVALIGEAPNHRALVSKLSKCADVVGVVLSQNIPKKPRPRTARQLLNKLAGRTVGAPLVNAWFGVLGRFAREFPELPPVPIARTRNVNDPETFAFLERHQADLVVVSGTNLVGKKLIAWAETRAGIVNLHTGLSPYVKGGPNCTNWCLATGQFHLIGNTTMWLDAGIDTGALIATEKTPLTGKEDLAALHRAVLDHAHDLYLRSVRAVVRGDAPKVPQSTIAEGTTYYSADWNARRMVAALANFKLKYRRAVNAEPPFPVVTHPLPSSP